MGLGAHSHSPRSIYTEPMKSLLAALALSLPSWAASEPMPATPVDAFRVHVADLAKSAADPFTTDAAVWTKAQGFFSNVPGTVIHVEANLRGWDFGRDALGDGKEVSAAELITHGRERITDLRGPVPSPNDPLKDSVAAASALHDASRVRVDDQGAMAKTMMGAFVYVKGRAETALIKLNQMMPAITGVIGKSFGYATVAHEGRHLEQHLKGQLSPDEVIKGEIAAFRTQYDWLVHVDPYGERLPYVRTALRNEVKRGRGGELAQVSLQYLDHLADVRATGGDERRIEELVHKLGYAEGHDHDHPAPATPLRN